MLAQMTSPICARKSEILPGVAGSLCPRQPLCRSLPTCLLLPLIPSALRRFARANPVGVFLGQSGNYAWARPRISQLVVCLSHVPDFSVNFSKSLAKSLQSNSQPFIITKSRKEQGMP